MSTSLRYVFLSILLFGTCLKHSDGADCTKNDIGTTNLLCDPKTQKRQIVSYKKNDCTLSDNSLLPKPVDVPCDCAPGTGLQGLECKACPSGSYGSGGEIIDNWETWSVNGSVPPEESDIVTYCDMFRDYVEPCSPWKATYLNNSIDSGDNSKTRCLISVLTLRKRFIMDKSSVSFTYRVDGRKCYRNYLGCDGLAFFVDNKEMMSYEGMQFDWNTFSVNLTAGYHQLKWVYRKSCYSFPKPGLLDKAYIQSITLVGTDEPKSTCSQCPAGSYSSSPGSASCKKCDYLTYQPDVGQTSCLPCPDNKVSMLGSHICYPMRNCTDDDLILSPGPLDSCVKGPSGIYQTIKPRYATVRINNKDHALCSLPNNDVTPVKKPCRCQPGYEIVSNGGKYMCQQCMNGLHSVDGIKCAECPPGQVALLGKHYYTWSEDSLPEGFSAGCAGDCAIKSGWISSGDHIRTSRVIGNVDSYLLSPEFEIISNLAMINFTCAVTCNITGAQSSVEGQHLADINFCNLVFQVWVNGSIVDEVNCTKPKGSYMYRHETTRDGRFVRHSYVLKNRTYTFRWMFQQADELRSSSASFEAKVANISVIGVKGGSAMNCTKCAGGSYSVAGNDCQFCGTGDYSQPGWSKCKPCPSGTFTDVPGSSECLRCGANTVSLPTRDGCTTNNCTFSPAEGVEYDLNELSRDFGPMFEVLSYQTGGKSSAQRSKRFISSHRWPPYNPSFYVNLCTVNHENNSCTFRKSRSSVRESLPVMACRTSWWGQTDTSLGKVIGFLPRKDIRSGVTVEILHGDKCYTSEPNAKLNATIDLICDPNAGIGNPGPEGNYTQVYRAPCSYVFAWYSKYACPKCRREDFELITSQCVDGQANVTYVPRVGCWGDVEGISTKPRVIRCSYQARVRTVQSSVNKVLIGVGVVVVVALLIVAGYFFWKHRAIRYKYYSMITRNKPMSKLEEEEEDFGHVGGDVYHDTSTMVRP
ncbi:endosome/lysosome-associated apoptosis and autophagy regulator family member 2 [Nematostella vectensis]|uniref:endosome/lysosome-associated apoptosis and autophagy regulator family member 2 n=1 Tax=Nematostella vectensis TaxID=45351 RepID=UPI002076D960|nr:endosome/lysosome-associated apoptosis and autophagy regulator family member 2 [Nematostella vectensis]